MGTGPTAAGNCRVYAWSRCARAAANLWLGSRCGVFWVLTLAREVVAGMQVLQDKDVGHGFRFQGWHSSFCQFRDPGRTWGPDPMG